MRVFNQYTGQMEEVPDEPGMAPAPAPAPVEQPLFVPQPVHQPLDPRVEQAKAFADAEVRGAGGGVAVDVTAPPAGMPMAQEGQVPAEPGVPLEDLVGLAVGGARRSGGPLTKQTMSREVQLAPQTPQDIAAADALKAKGAQITATEQKLADDQKQASLKRQEYMLDEQEMLDARQRDFDRKLQERKDVMQQRADGYSQLVQQKRQEIESAKIDPDDLWKETGGISRVFAAIAVGLGQIGASLKGGRNVALDIVDAAIERNVQSQKDNLQKNKELLAEAKDSYAQSVNALGDEDAAAAVYKDQLYTDFIRRLGATKEMTQEEDKRMAIDEMINQAEAKRLQTAQDSMQKYLGTAVIEQTQRSGGGGGRGNALKNYKDALAVKKLEQEVLGTKPDQGEKGNDQAIPGLGVASSKKGAEQVRATIDFSAKAIANLHELQGISENAGAGDTVLSHLPGGRLISPEVSAAEDLAGDTALLLAKAKDPDSVIRKEEEERERKKVRDPHKIGKDSTRSGYELQIKQAVQAVRSRAAANGLDPDLAEDILNANIARLRGSGSSQGGGGGFKFGEP